MNDIAFEEIAERLLQTLYERMMFRSAEVYSEGWAVEKIKSALCEAAHLTPGAADTATPRADGLQPVPAIPELEFRIEMSDVLQQACGLTPVA